MSQSRVYILILVLASLISALGGILGNVASGMLPPAWGPYLWLAWPLFVVCLLAGAGLLIWQLRIEERITPPSQADQLQTQPYLPSSDLDAQAAQETPAEPVPDVPPHREDWGEAVDVEIFYGREEELAKLERWLLADRCRLVALLGMGGIGKTALVTRLAHQVKDEFDYVIWRSLRNAPPLEDVLGECIKFVSDQEETGLPDDAPNRISLLIEYLRDRRCLLVLDNVETILREDGRAGHYREDYAAYGDFIRRVGETSHQSCLVLTSREKPREFALLEGEASPVRSILLAGLDYVKGKQLLQGRGLVGTEEMWMALADHYSGNPLALKLVSETIQEVFGGDIAVFLKEGATVFGGIRDVLDQQFGRLSVLEQEVMFWLAIEREAISLDELQENIPHPVPRRELVEALRSLRRRSLVEQGTEGFTLQNVVMEYVTDYLIDQVCEEITTETVAIFQSHALIKAQAKDYIRESQVCLILKPVADHLSSTLGKEVTEDKIRNILSTLRQIHPRQKGYIGGNVLNLLVHLKSDVSDCDFSNLTLRQAYLRGVDLHGVSFAYSDLTGSVFNETFGCIVSVAFSLDGALLATGAANGDIYVWHVGDGRQLLKYRGHDDWVEVIVFSPDGRTFASGGNERTVKLWDAKTGQCQQVLDGHDGRVMSLAFMSDGRTVVSGSDDQTVRFWDITKGECVKTLKGPRDWERVVVISPDSRIFASGSLDNTIELWDTNTGKCLKTLIGHTSLVRSIAFSPDGNIIASGSLDNTIRLWDARTGECFHLLEGHTNWVRSVVFSSDGNLLASGSSDQTIRLWSVNDGKCLNTLQGHSNWVRSVAFSPTGHLLASGSEDRSMRLWDVRTGLCLRVLQGHTNIIWSVAFDLKGYTLASGSEDQNVRLWDLRTGKSPRMLKGHTNLVWSVAFSPDDHILASSSSDQTVILWDVRTGQRFNTLRGHTGRIRSAIFDPTGGALASCSDDGTVRVWDISTGRQLATFQGHSGKVWSVAISPDSKLLASCGDDKSVRIWDMRTGQCLKILQGHTSPVWSVGFNHDSCVLASGSSDQTIRLWDVGTGDCTRTLKGHDNPVWSLVFSPDGHILASSSGDQTIRLWDASTGQCLRILHGHTNQVRSVAFSSAGETLASSSDDETIKLWDMQTGDCLKTLRIAQPYERMNITGVTGLTEAQKATIRALGAIEAPAEQTNHVKATNKVNNEPESGVFGRGYALVVGVGADLPVTIGDATAVADLLRDPDRCAYPPDQVQLLTGEDAHREAVLSALGWLAETTNADATAVVYFSGHGLETPDYYLLPYGYELADLPGTAIPGPAFTERLRSIQAGKLVVFLDCCHAGGQAEAKGWPGIKSPVPPTAVAELARSSGRVVIASSRKDEVSWTGQPYSVFTTALLEGLAGYGAFEQDGYARVLDLALWVGRKVPERTGDKQHPIVKVSHLEDNFALAWYAAGEKRPRPLEWAALPSIAPDLDADQVVTWQRMLNNYRENLLLIEERMSEYVEFTTIPLQLIKEKRRTEEQIAGLERKLGLRS